VGKNYWTFEPAASLSYMSSKMGLELSAFAGIDFNMKNTDTEYRSGTQFHLDLTVAQHLPLFSGIIGIGANGFWYQQVSGDSGSGATLCLNCSRICEGMALRYSSCAAEVSIS
jgi:hypothetical protein